MWSAEADESSTNFTWPVLEYFDPLDRVLKKPREKFDTFLQLLIDTRRL